MIHSHIHIIFIDMQVIFSINKRVYHLLVEDNDTLISFNIYTATYIVNIAMLIIILIKPLKIIYIGRLCSESGKAWVWFKSQNTSEITCFEFKSKRSMEYVSSSCPDLPLLSLPSKSAFACLWYIITNLSFCESIKQPMTFSRSL